MVAGGGGDGDHVAAHGVLDGDVFEGLLHPDEGGGVDDRVEFDVLGAASDAPPQDLPLLVGGGVAEGDAQEEPVELGLGQLVGALELDGVGGGQDREGPREPVGLALDRDLPLLHGLQERGLRLRGRPVDLVGEQQVRVDRALAVDELAGLLVVEEGAGDVGGEQVGGELEAPEVEPEALGEAPRGEGLAEAGEVFEEDVAPGEDAREHQFQRLVLADDDGLDGLEDGLRVVGDLGEADRRCLVVHRC